MFPFSFVQTIGNGARKQLGNNKRLKTDKLALSLSLCFPSPFEERDLQLNLVTAAAQL